MTPFLRRRFRVVFVVVLDRHDTSTRTMAVVTDVQVEGDENNVARMRYVTKYLITISNPIELLKTTGQGRNDPYPPRYDRHCRLDGMHPKGNQSYYDDGRAVCDLPHRRRI